MHLLQCCNVGDILGGTAACAWSLARALPGCRHTIGFFGAVSEETRRAFAGCQIVELGRLEAVHVRRLGVDGVVLHNTPGSRVLGPLPAVTLLYYHARFRGGICGDGGIYCSRWLADCHGADRRLVCYQGVPVPPGGRRAGPEEGRALGKRALVVGRLCTPQARKWPAETADFYRVLAGRLASIHWEFVGCPEEMQAGLAKACSGRARFFPADWQARRRLWHWDVWCYSNPGVVESFGRVCAEAMRASCVAVTDRQGGFCEQVEEGVSGFVCGNEEEFVAALEQLQEGELRRRLSQAAQERADRLFSLQAFGRRILTWLEATARAGG